MFQLCIALNFEQPNLGLGVNFEPSSLSNWGSGFVGVGKISDKVMQLVRKDRIMWYKFASRFTPFNQRVGDALRVVVGGSQYYTAEALSISGYNMDFEILFDADHRPISIPDQWKRHSKDHLLHSIGLGHEKGGTLSPADLLETSAQMEGKTDASISTADTVGDINLASDWGQKFIIPSTPVSKKIAIEADGPWHFASNCNHVMGDTVLKHRQLKALGWEVISVRVVLIIIIISYINYCVLKPFFWPSNYGKIAFPSAVPTHPLTLHTYMYIVNWVYHLYCRFLTESGDIWRLETSEYNTSSRN